MIFDTFCGMAERHWPEVIPMLKAAHLFDFPADPHVVLPKSYDADTAALLSETFFLPFSVVAVEDPVSCVLLFDRVADQQGVGAERYFAECLPLDYKHLSRTAEGEIDLKHLANVPPGLSQIAFGRIKNVTVQGPEVSPPLQIEGLIDRIVVCDKRKVHESDDGSLVGMGLTYQADEIRKSVLRNVLTAFEELFYFNTPNRFVVERTKVGGRPPPKHLQILRSEHRSRYILLTPGEIAERFEGLRDPHDARRSPVPHHRRRHYRRLQSERFKEARGKVLCIPASWIGPSEAVQDDVRYRVRLDL